MCIEELLVGDGLGLRIGCLGYSVISILSFAKSGLVYIRLGYRIVGTDLVGDLNWLRPYASHSTI